jgi:HEAT repeat protein
MTQPTDEDWVPSKDDWTERRRLIVAAKDRGDGRYLTEALLDPDHRALAAKYVGELGVAEAANSLLRLLVANDPQVRAAAATALGQLGSEDALPRLREVALHDEEAFVRSWAIGALGKIGDPEDVALLVPLLEDSSWRVRAGTVLALGCLGDARSLQPLRTARRRLRRSPLEWRIYRRMYNDAIEALEK